MNQMRVFLDQYTWVTMEYDEKIVKFDTIFQYIYENKELLKNNKFKSVTLDKINMLKEEGEFIGYYWSQKIY